MLGMPQDENFSRWLLSELEGRNWSQSDLARRAKVSNAAISDVLSGRRNIGSNLAYAIALAMNVPVEVVYREAGLLPPRRANDLSNEVEQIIHEAEGMTREEQLELLSYIRWRTNLREKKK